MKVLIVDDARDVLIILKTWLKQMGHEVLSADDGEQAWEILQHEEVQVVISDWKMPKLDGLGLCRKIRESYYPNYIYIILLTGMSSKKDLIAGLNAGADDFAKKPLVVDELEVRLNSAKRVLNLEQSLGEQNTMLQKAYDELSDTHRIIERDLHHASVLQQAMLPNKWQETIDISWFYRPALQVGGDTFNCFMPTPDVFVFYMVDVSGHGISSALMSIFIHTMLSVKINQYLEEDFSKNKLALLPEEIVNYLNKEITTQSGLDHYCTMVFGIASLSEGKIHYVQAGHPNPFFFRPKDKQIIELKGDGFPVGLLEDATYETNSIDFHPSDQLLVYSDGFSDVLADAYKDKDMAGCLADSIQKHVMHDIEKSLLIDEVIAHQQDDISIFVMEFNT